MQKYAGKHPLRKEGTTIGDLNPDLCKRKDETDLDYHKRLVYGKLVDKTMADCDYTELSEYLYGKSYSSDVARRMMYGSKRTLELLDADELSQIKDDKVIAEINRKLLTLKKEQQKFFDQRREYGKVVAIDSRTEHLYSVLEEAAMRLPETVGSVFADEYALRTDSDAGSEAVLVLGDWHYGLVADNAFNRYDTVVCVNRVREVVSEATKRILLHKCSKLHIVVLGDMWHGAIHTSARVASEELVSDQIMNVSEILAQTIDTLSTYADSVVVYMTYGNHGRTVPNKKDNIHRDNLERLVPWWLAQRLKDNSRVSFADDTGTEFLLLDVCGHDICATHGDLDNVKNSPRLLSTLLQKKFGKDVEYIILGDQHHRESFEELGVNAAVCGSLCGTDDYANGKRLYSTPSQLLLIVNRENGVDAEYRIRCKN